MRIFTALLLLSSLSFASPSEFDGNWISGCAGTEGGYSRETIKIGDNKMDYVVAVYGDAGCTNRYADMITKATFDIGALSQSLINTRETQVIFSSIVMIPRSGFVAMMMNSRKVCGFTNWQANVSKDISGHECEGMQVPKIGDSAYDLASLQSGKLLYGLKTEENDGTSPEKRPKELDKAKPFSKY